MFTFTKKSKMIFFGALALFIISCTSFFTTRTLDTYLSKSDDEIIEVVDNIIKSRNKAMLYQDLETLDSMYDKSTKYGVWAYEHEIKKMKYLRNWSDKQNIEFLDISPKVVIRNIKQSEGIYSINLLCSTTYKYAYLDSPDITNEFRIGTYHSLKLVNKDDTYLVKREWYTDPFADSLNLENIKTDVVKRYIVSQQGRDLSGINKRRLDAVAYADQFCGAASEEKYGFKFNPKYKNYNPLGGDCANFASQILFEGGKFRKNGTWNYNQSGGSKSWVNAQAFKNYMVNSGRASVIAHGNYDSVYKASYKLLPGDFVAYEKKGKITHISVVTGVDSKGYSLVSCHNTDRHRVPWDLGWSNKNIKFWLVRVHV